MTKLDLDVVLVKKEQYTAEGGFSRYYRLDNKHGVKVYKCKGYPTIDKLFNSKKWLQALMEYVFYQEAQNNTKMSPQKVSIVIVQKEKRYYPGIFMEHIEGIAYEDFRRMGMKLFVTKEGEVTPEKEKDSQELQRYIKKTLKDKAKIEYRDGNFQNYIIEHSGNIRVIDFTPHLCIMEGLF
jgi:hypothetical protein